MFEDTFVIFNNNDDSVHFLKVKSFKIANSKPFRLRFILTVFIKDLWGLIAMAFLGTSLRRKLYLRFYFQRLPLTTLQWKKEISPQQNSARFHGHSFLIAQQILHMRKSSNMIIQSFIFLNSWYPPTFTMLPRYNNTWITLNQFKSENSF